MRGKGEGSVFKDSRGLWTATVELPSLDGRRRRKVIRSKDKKTVVTKLAELKDELRKRGDLPTDSLTAEQWFTYWLDRIAAKEVRPNTLDQYRRTITLHVIPAIGTVKLDKLNATHIRRVHDAILAKGLSSTTALLAHRTMSVSFKIAVREGRIGRNPTTLTNAPRKAAPTLEALDLPEALHVLQHVATIPGGALWATALLTGARRGEIIGLERDRIDGDTLDLSWQLQRIAWQHGCRGTCNRAPQHCPQRQTTDVPADYELRHIEGGLYWTRPKSSKSWRIIPLVDPLRAILAEQIAHSPDNPWGLVFTRTDRPIGPDLVGKDWRKVLAAAGIEKNVRFHDIRHTTVDLLYLAGIPEDIIMLIVGHSIRATLRGYQSKQNRERLTAAMIQFSQMLQTAQRPALEA